MKKIFLFILVLIILSCKNAESGNQKEVLITNKIELEILSLLPSEYFEHGYSRAGYLEGDAQIFFTKDALNVSYLINGQSIMEKGTPLNIVLTENNARKKILKGEWDNHTAGDGIFIVYLYKGNVCVQIEGQNGANWWYKAETKVSLKLYEKLEKLFYGNENYKKEIEKTDSVDVVSTDTINDNSANESSYSGPKLINKTEKIIEETLIFTQFNCGAHDCILEFKNDNGELIEFMDSEIKSYDFINSESKYVGEKFKIKYRKTTKEYEDDTNFAFCELIYITKVRE